MINYTKMDIEMPLLNILNIKTKRDIARSKHKLSEEFLSTYPDYPDCMDELGKFVYIRTY